MKKKKHAPEKPKWKKSQLEYCKKCKHDHTSGTGPCTEFGCGCHALSDADKPVREQIIKEFIKKKYTKKDKEKK